MFANESKARAAYVSANRKLEAALAEYTQARTELHKITGAYGAYARLEAYKALAESEEALTRAMALMTHASEPTGIDRQADDPRAYRMKFIWQRLSAVAMERPEAQQRPEVEALGPLELGAFAGRAFLTPVKAMQLQRAEAEAATA